MNGTDAVWAVGRLTIGTAVKLVAPLRVYGAERVPARGGLVVAANHFSWLDPPALGSASPRTLYFMAKVEAHRVPGLGQLMRSFGAFAVRRGESDRDAVRTMRQIVRDGHALGMFAEGTRQREVPGPVQPGAAMVAINESVPLIPVAIHGSQHWQLELRPDLARLGRADDLRGAPARRKGLQGGIARGRAQAAGALAVARGDPRARAPSRCDPATMTRSRRAPSGRASGDEQRAVEPVEIAGTVAIVGFPNVGKSTLVNRLTETRAAVVHETPGVTRDRKELTCEWSGTTFRLIDTGGVDREDTGPFGPQVAAQARQAVEEADLVLFVVDAKAGVTPGDEELAEILRSSRRDVLVIANKLDDPRRDAEALEFHRLGLGDPIPLSALHGHGTGDLLDDIVARLPGKGERPVGEEAIRVAILGRPNVGKSSLLNALLGRERVIVSEVPGTTRDSIDTVLRRGETTFVLVDTAGLRRKRKQRQGIEYYSELRALEAAERADVALVLVDASEGVVDQDLSVADTARKAQCATVVVLSKWDVGDVRIEDVRPHLAKRLRQRPPILAVSSATGRGLERLLDTVEDVFSRYAGRIATAELNRALQELREARQPPGRRGRRLNILYGTQVSSRPPRFRVFVNDRRLVTRDYGYWVENELRQRFRLEGVPVSIDFVTSE